MLLEQSAYLGCFGGLYEELRLWALAFRRGDEGVRSAVTGTGAREGAQCLPGQWKVDSDA